MSEFLARLRDQLGLRDKHRILGFTFILAVATIWVIASFAVQGIESSGVHPAVLTFIANSLFALYLPIYWLGLQLKKRRNSSSASAAAGAPPSPRYQEGDALFPQNQLRSDAEYVEDPDTTHVGFSDHGLTPLGTGNAPRHPEETSRTQLFRAACVVAPLWFLAQLTFNASLERTSVTSNTILSSASALFTFLFSVVFLSERFTLVKLGCIFALIGGTTMVTVADSSAGGGGGEGSVSGDLLCLLSSVIYGAYTVAIRQMLGEDEGVAMTLFFGFMGSLIFTIVGPGLGLAKLLGAGLGSMTWTSFGLVIAKGLLDNVLSDYLWARAILLVGPTLATAGLSMQVPIAITLDAIVRNPKWMGNAGAAVLTFLGGAVILAGFFVLTATTSPGDGTAGSGASASTGDEGQLERVWARQGAALEAELGGGEEVGSGEFRELISNNGAGGSRGRTATIGYAVGTSGRVNLPHGSPSSPHRRTGLSPFPHEPKYSLD